MDEEFANESKQLGVVLVSFLASLYSVATFNLYRTKFVDSIDQLQQVVLADDALKDAPLKHFTRISAEMEIVYRLAVFDGFLTNLTRYAFVARPEKVVGNAQMHVGKLINSTKAAIINSHIEAKIRKVGAGSFVERILALEKVIGFKVSFSDSDKEKVKLLSKIRNEIVHTAGTAFSFSLDERMTLSANLESAKITIPDDLDEFCLSDIGANIYETLVTKFVGRELNQIEQYALAGLRSNPSGPDNILI